MRASWKHRIGLALAPALLVSAAAIAEEPCRICSTSVVTNRGLADCFLGKYASLASGTGNAVAVDLSDCPQNGQDEVSRGIVRNLGGRTWGPPPVELDTEFVLTHRQLSCLKAQLEDPNLDLDPSKRIEFEACE